MNSSWAMPRDSDLLIVMLARDVLMSAAFSSSEIEPSMETFGSLLAASLRLSAYAPSALPAMTRRMSPLFDSSFATSRSARGFFLSSTVPRHETSFASAGSLYLALKTSSLPSEAMSSSSMPPGKRKILLVLRAHLLHEIRPRMASSQVRGPLRPRPAAG